MSDIISRIKDGVAVVVDKIGRKNPKDKFVVQHVCHYMLAPGKKCNARILENKALDSKTEGWCGRKCLFMAEYFANVYAPPQKNSNK